MKERKDKVSGGCRIEMKNLGEIKMIKLRENEDYGISASVPS
jgi:hypothetical protein